MASVALGYFEKTVNVFHKRPTAEAFGKIWHTLFSFVVHRNVPSLF